MTDLTPISEINQQNIGALTDSINLAKGFVIEQLKKQGTLSLSQVLKIVKDIAKTTSMNLPRYNPKHITQIIIESLKKSREINFNPKGKYFELVKPSRGIFIDTARNLFTTGSRTVKSAVQIARSSNTLRAVITGGPAALATEAGIVTAAGITIAAGGGYLLGIGIRNIPTGKDKNGQWKNIGDDWEWLFHNYYWNKHYQQDILSDEVKKRIK